MSGTSSRIKVKVKVKKVERAPTIPLEPTGRLGPLWKGNLSTRMKAGNAKVRGRGAKSSSGKRRRKLGWETDSSQPGIVAIFKKMQANLGVNSHGIQQFPLKTECQEQSSSSFAKTIAHESFVTRILKINRN